LQLSLKEIIDYKVNFSSAYLGTSYGEQQSQSTYQETVNKISYFSSLYELYNSILTKFLTNPSKHLISFENNGIEMFQDELFIILIKALNDTDIFTKLEEGLLTVPENDSGQLLHDVIKNRGVPQQKFVNVLHKELL
jgi:hypothetical protein